MTAANADLRTINEISQDLEDSKFNSPQMDRASATLGSSLKKSKLDTTVLSQSGSQDPKIAHYSELKNKYRPQTQRVDSLEDEHSNYNLSNSKGSLPAEWELRKMQEYFEDKLAFEKKEIEDALNDFWEKRLDEVSRAYQAKIDNV